MATETLSQRPRKPHVPSLTIVGKKGKRISMWLPEDLRATLKTDAAETGVPYSEIIRQVTESFLQIEEEKRRSIISRVHEGRNFTDEGGLILQAAA